MREITNRKSIFPLHPAGEPSPEVEQFFQEIRDYLVGEFRGHAVGKMSLDEVRSVACEDLDALDDWLAAEAELGREVLEGDSPMGDSVERE